MLCQKVSNSSFSLPLSIFDEVQYLQEFWNQDKKIYHVFRLFQAAYKIFNPIQEEGAGEVGGRGQKGTVF